MIETVIEWLSNLQTWEVRSLQAFFILISLPGIAAAYYVWIHSHVEDLWECVKDAATGWDQIPEENGMQRIDCNGNQREEELSAADMVERINRATLESRRSYQAYEAHTAAEVVHRQGNVLSLRDTHNLYEGNNHDLGFLLLGYVKIGYTPRASRLFPNRNISLKGYHPQESQTQERKDTMKTIILAILASLAIAMYAACPAQGASSVTASGDVFSITSNGLKIEQANGSKVTALRGNNPLVHVEYDNADLGEYAFGRATCQNGICTWVCLEVVDECSTEGKYFALAGKVTGKDSCAGVLFVTVLINTGGEMRAPCLGDVAAMCQSVDIGENVYVEFDLTCGDTYWRAMVGL